MMLRMIRLHKPLQAYFNNHFFSSRALHATEWRSIRQFASILDPAAIVTAQIQGGRHGFIGKATNDFTCLFSSMVDDTQEIRDLDDPHNGPRTEVSKNTLNTEVQRALEVMTQDMGQRNLGKAILDIEAINLVLDHRFKSCYTGVCLNGGPALRAQVGTAMQGLCYEFVGSVGAVDKGDDGGATGAGEPVGEGAGGNEAAGGGGAEGGDAAPVPKISRMEKIRRRRSLLVVQPNAGAGAEEDLSRSTAAEREFEDYMKMPPAAHSHDFDLLNAWKSYATDGVDAKTGKVVTPARLPHIGLVARLNLGIDATSCQAERNFSALSALPGDLQSNLGRRKVEMMMLLMLNQQLIPGLANVLQQVADLKDATAAGNVVSLS